MSTQNEKPGAMSHAPAAMCQAAGHTAPARPSALAASIAELDAFLDGDCAEVLTPAQSEAAALVLQELKRRMAINPAAPAVDVETLRTLSDLWANDRGYTGSPVDDIRALIEQPTMSTPAAPALYVNKWELDNGGADGVVAMRAGRLDAQRQFFTVPLYLAPAAPGIDLAALRDIVSDLSHSAKVDDYEPQQVAFIDSIRDRLSEVIDASPKGGSDCLMVLDALVSLAAVARRYLPDYDEHPEVQKADAAIDATIQTTSAEVGA